MLQKQNKTKQKAAEIANILIKLSNTVAKNNSSISSIQMAEMLDKVKTDKYYKQKMTVKQKSKNSNYNLVNRKHNTFLSFFIGSGMSNFVCS